jgi:hypothetical protein
MARDVQVKVFRSFAEAEEADRAYYRSLTPRERLAILLELNRHYWPTSEHAEAAERPARVRPLTELT